MWEDTWNQIYLVVLNFCFERSHDVTISYLMIRHDQTIGVNDLSCLEHTEQSTSVTEMIA